MTRQAVLIAAALLAITLAGFFFFPGHTYLQSDTQIYIPIFERIEHPKVYERDFLMQAAHVGLTIYDETAIGLQRVTGGTFESLLEFEQIVFRALGLWGVFLIATSVGFGAAEALLVAACYGLGATIVGPAVLSVEYEPVPRGFAVAFVLLASGLLMQGRYAWACVAASVGFLYHSPTTIPFWILFAVVILRSPKLRWKASLPFAGAMAVLAVTFAAQRGVARPQGFFLSIDPQWESITRMRTAYDWVGQWPSGSVLAFLLFCALALAAVWRVRAVTNWTQRMVLAGFPLLGIGSIAMSALLLDHWKWAFMAQVQPARAALFTVVFAQISCALAGMYALREGRRRWLEALLWFLPVFVAPVAPQFIHGLTLAQAVAILLLVFVAVTPLVFERARWLASPAVVAVACWLIPHYAHTVNYPDLHSVELDGLSEWGRANTPEQAMFVFPVSGHNLEQGVFRVKALRSLYVDWKAGGQANYFRDFAIEWQRRWDELSSGKLTPDSWRARGVDYLVYAGPRIEDLGEPVFQNAKYRAYRLAPR
ncbi:MAG TPA: DUF6798 domain-containing protein [Bryobacteraceae bacterium]|jgi:hypothetical protein